MSSVFKIQTSEMRKLIVLAILMAFASMCFVEAQSPTLLSGTSEGNSTSIGHQTITPTKGTNNSHTQKTTGTPTQNPSARASPNPAKKPTDQPGSIPTSPQPTGSPSHNQSTPPTSDIRNGEKSANNLSVSDTLPSMVPTVARSLSQPNYTEPSSSPSGNPSATPSSNPSVPYPGLSSGYPTETLSTSPSSRPTILPTSAPTERPSDLPSSMPTDIPSTNPSGRPTAAPSLNPSIPPSLQPSGIATAEPPKPSTTPSVLPSFSEKIPSVEELLLPTSTAPLSPTVKSSSSVSYETTVSVPLNGQAEPLDTTQQLILETTIIQLLSEKITEIEGAAIFFLKAQVASQTVSNRDRKLSIKVLLIQVHVKAVVVSGKIDEQAYHQAVQKALTDDAGDLQLQLQHESKSFSGRIANGGDSQQQNKRAPPPGGKNMVILTAILVSSGFLLVGLFVTCLAIFIRKKARDRTYEKEIEKIMTDMGSPPRASRTFDGQEKAPVELNRSRSGLLSPDIEKNCSCHSSKPDLPHACLEETHQGGYESDRMDGMEEIELVEIQEEGKSSIAKVAAIIGGGFKGPTTAEMLCQHDYSEKSANTQQLIPGCNKIGVAEINSSTSGISDSNRNGIGGTGVFTAQSNSLKWSKTAPTPTIPNVLHSKSFMKPEPKTPRAESMSSARLNGSARLQGEQLSPTKRSGKNDGHGTSSHSISRRMSTGDVRSVRSNKQFHHAKQPILYESRRASSSDSRSNEKREAGEILDELDSLEGHRGITPKLVKMGRNPSTASAYTSRAHHSRSLERFQPQSNRVEFQHSRSSESDRQRANVTVYDADVESRRSRHFNRERSRGNPSAVSWDSSIVSSIFSHSSYAQSAASESADSPSSSIVSSSEYSRSSSNTTGSRSSVSNNLDQDRYDDSFLLKLKQTVSTAAYSRSTAAKSVTSKMSSPYIRQMTMSASSGGTNVGASPSIRSKSQTRHQLLPPQSQRSATNSTCGASGLETAASMFGF